MVKKLTEVNKGELAKYLNVSSPMITKHVKSGILDKCFTPNGKKLYLEKATLAIELAKRRDSKGVVKNITPKEIQEDETLYTEESEYELSKLLLAAQSPSQKVQITKDYWTGKINRQKFMEQEGELISMEDAKGAFHILLTPFNQYLDDLSNNIKNHFPESSDKLIKWVTEENNRQKKQLQGKVWEI